MVDSTLYNLSRSHPTEYWLPRQSPSLEASVEEYRSVSGTEHSHRVVDTNPRRFEPKVVVVEQAVVPPGQQSFVSGEHSRPTTSFPRASNHSFLLSTSLKGGGIGSSALLSSVRRRSGMEMSDSQLLSSPSTNASKSPNSSIAFKSPGSRGSSTGSDEPFLVVVHEPPTFVYSNESFQVNLQLEIPKTLTPPFPSRGNEFELIASLFRESSDKDSGPDVLLVTQPSRISLVAGEDGIHRCQVVCMIRVDSITRDQGASLAVRFRARPESSPSLPRSLQVLTSPIHIVNYKIRIVLSDDWGSVWYKDEGGRDKSIELFVAIYDKDGQLRTGEQIPLCPVLCYKSASGGVPIPVSNQDILRTLGASRIVIDKDTGRARIRFRVEDVSKNHQGQDFVLMVGPDPKAKGFKDIAPDYTPAINIRSKRNKRSRTVLHQRTTSDISKRLSPSATHAYEQQREPGSPIQQADVPRVREALRSVFHWADAVVSGLLPLQWQVLGYPQHPDGSTDYHRPYHNMPNPNPSIRRILGMYSDTVRDSLRVLLTAVEQANPGHAEDPSSLLPMPMAVPGLPIDDGMYGPVMRGPTPPQPGHMPGHLGMNAGMNTHGMQRRVVMGHQGVGPGDPYAVPPRHDLPSMYQGGGSMIPPPHMMHPHHPNPMSPAHAYVRSLPPEGDLLPMHLSTRTELPATMAPGDHGLQQRSLRPEDESRENEVEYVLAKQYKAVRTGERLGFPAYSENKEILGFYREQRAGGARQFSPISRHRNDFGPLEILQATQILDDAINKKSEAVHSLREWGSIENVLDQALVYDWEQDRCSRQQGPSS